MRLGAPVTATARDRATESAGGNATPLLRNTAARTPRGGRSGAGSAAGSTDIQHARLPQHLLRLLHLGNLPLERRAREEAVLAAAAAGGRVGRVRVRGNGSRRGRGGRGRGAGRRRKAGGRQGRRRGTAAGSGGAVLALAHALDLLELVVEGQVFLDGGDAVAGRGDGGGRERGDEVVVAVAAEARRRGGGLGPLLLAEGMVVVVRRRRRCRLPEGG